MTKSGYDRRKSSRFDGDISPRRAMMEGKVDVSASIMIEKKRDL